MIEITKQTIDIKRAVESVFSPDAGGIDVFVGTVRNLTQNKPVERLEFESYEKMAIAEMKKIEQAARKQWPVLKITMIHRIGSLQVGEIPVIIAVSTAHRKDAFEACKYIIDTLKEKVPIWKKEVFEDGEVWVNAHP